MMEKHRPPVLTLQKEHLEMVEQEVKNALALPKNEKFNDRTVNKGGKTSSELWRLGLSGELAVHLYLGGDWTPFGKSDLTLKDGTTIDVKATDVQNGGLFAADYLEMKNQMFILVVQNKNEYTIAGYKWVADVYQKRYYKPSKDIYFLDQADMDPIQDLEYLR